MTINPEDECPRPAAPPELHTCPLAPPIYPASVYRCDTPEQAQAILTGEAPGYVYSRDGHPNSDMLADKLRRLHHAD